MMSAGSGIRHSEFNHSATELVHLLQIWIKPNQFNVTPRYQQVHFTTEQKRGRLCPIITPDGRDGSLSVYQDVTVYAGCFTGAEQATLSLLDTPRHVYIHIARGRLLVNGNLMVAGDGARLRQCDTILFDQGHDAEVLVFNLRPQE